MSVQEPSRPLKGASIYEISIGDHTHRVSVRRLSAPKEGGLGQQYGVCIDDELERVVDVVRPQPSVLSLLVDARCVEAGVVPSEDGFEVEALGISHLVQVLDPRRKALRMAEATSAGAIKSSMPGRIVRILVAEGDAVLKGQPVVVVEAMKMENELKAPAAGVVARICVRAGDVVEAKTVLVELSPNT